MKIPSLGINMHLSSEERTFLKCFFKETHEFIETQDMLNSENIGVYADKYIEYLNNSEFVNCEPLKIFHYELKLSQLKEKKIENGEIKLSPRQRMYRKSVPASSTSTHCKNSIINKWRSESRIVYTVSRADINELNARLEPILKQNAKERKLSWEAARNTWVGSK